MPAGDRWPSYGCNDLKGDVFGGIVSAVMMVPVALGFGVLSGLGPVAGFYGAIAVGCFTALLGAAAPMISGPSAIVDSPRRVRRDSDQGRLGHDGRAVWPTRCVPNARRSTSPDLADHEVVIFDCNETEAMDDNAAMALEELINGSVLDQDKGCIVAGLSGGVKQTLISLGIFDRLPKASFANDLEKARQAAVQLLPK